MPKISEMDWGDWLYALFGTFIGGGSSAASAGITVALTDSAHYNIQSWAFYRLMISVFIVNGLLGAFLLLKQKPLPDARDCQSKSTSTGQ